MPDTYEAIYEDGRLHWIGAGPGGGPHRVLVTVLTREPRPGTPTEVRRVLEETRGAWGKGKSLEQIDADIRTLRDEWDRFDADV